MKVVTSAQMREIERAAEERGVSLDDLARRAGKSLANLVQNDALDGRVLVLVGPGNNGKDGILCVDALQERGLRPIVYSVLRAAIPSETPHHIRAEDDEDQTQLREILSTRVVIVDALLGVGQNRAPEGLLASVIKTVNSDQSDSTLVVAADIPTGVNADTGVVPGVAIRANLTVAMGFVKLGTALYPGAEYAGHVLVDHLGLDPNLVDLFRINVPGEDEIRELLPVRKAASNKGSSGRMLMIGGSRDFVGAPVLAGLAAYRAGAGLVEIAVPASIQPSVASHALEPIYRSLPDVNGTLGTDAVPIIRAALGHARAVVFGPGMSLTDGTIGLTAGVLEALDQANIQGAVIDADGLNALARLGEWWPRNFPLVLTPHPGEMSRLTGLSIADIQRDRVEVTRRFAALWGVVVVLKGAGTVVASPDGRASINSTGGPNLATAGTGDVLSGIVGGLLAQGRDTWQAAVAGVYLHGEAGDMLRAEQGDIGTIASDLLETIPLARRSILEYDEDVP